MSFTHKLSIIKIEDFEELKRLHSLLNFNVDEYSEEHEFYFDFKSDKTKRLHDMGYLGIDLDVVIDLSDDDTDYKVITSEGIIKIIDYYRSQHLSYLKEIKENEHPSPDNKEDIDPSDPTITKYINSEIRKWSRLDNMVNLRDDSDEVTSNWSYQYAIFELVRIYKTIDYEKYLVVFEGN